MRVAVTAPRLEGPYERRENRVYFLPFSLAAPDPPLTDRAAADGTYQCKPVRRDVGAVVKRWSARTVSTPSRE
jgi:hypothetical protein